jgi:peptide deformylase
LPLEIAEFSPFRDLSHLLNLSHINTEQQGRHMAILKIARMGHPVLKRQADPVADPKSDEIQRLIQDMLETLVDIGGAGLAAPQVHVPLRLVIFHVPAARMAREGEAGDGVPMTVLINPEITPLTEEMAPGIEACLSVPGLAGLVPRYTHIRYRGLDPQGREIDREARGFHARVVQHECDHLDGILYPMRMTDLSSLGFVEELQRVAKQMDEIEEGAADA